MSTSTNEKYPFLKSFSKPFNTIKTYSIKPQSQIKNLLDEIVNNEENNEEDKEEKKVWKPYTIEEKRYPLEKKKEYSAPYLLIE